MIHDDARILINVINNTKKFKPTPKDQSVMGNIVNSIKAHKKLSDKQGWALQEIYRRSQKDAPMYSRIITIPAANPTRRLMKEMVSIAANNVMRNMKEGRYEYVTKIQK